MWKQYSFGIMNIVFASNSYFGTVVLENLIKNNVRISFLITSPSKKEKRGLEFQQLFIKDFATKKGLDVEVVKDKDSFHEIIKQHKPSLVIVAGMRVILPQKTLELSNFINVHPSLLPKYRGATPIQSAILDGNERSGVTIIKMNEKVDSGPIIAQSEFYFDSRIKYPEAEQILAKKGGELLAKKIEAILKEEITPTKQDDSQATYTKKLKKEDGKINWRESAQSIERKVRAFNPWPGTYCNMGKKTVKIIDAEIQEQTEHGPFNIPGKMYLGTNHTIAVETGKDFLLIKKLQIEGKNSTNAKDFIQGNMQSMGITLT